jgi:hypothetical protein
VVGSHDLESELLTREDVLNGVHDPHRAFANDPEGTVLAAD